MLGFWIKCLKLLEIYGKLCLEKLKNCTLCVNLTTEEVQDPCIGFPGNLDQARPVI